MEKRKLASVQYVHHISSIEGADRIECIHVLGWQCVANKGQFQVGEKCVPGHRHRRRRGPAGRHR